MNINFGKNLHKLRIENHETQTALADAFNEVYLTVTPVAISDWEKGRTLPELDKIEFLCDHYNKTIDELIYGEDIPNIDFNEEYNIDPDEELCEQMSLKDFANINIKTKNFIKLYLQNKNTKREEKELIYLLRTFYVVDIFRVISLLDRLRIEKKMTLDEKCFEISKLLVPNPAYQVWYGQLSSDVVNEDAREIFETLEDYQKDIILANMWFYSNSILSYEKDENVKAKVIADTYRYLVDKGAQIVPQFTNKTYIQTSESTIIETITKLYNAAIKPLKVCDDKNNVYQVENNKRNRLLINNSCICSLVDKLGYKIEEAIALLESCKTIPDEILDKFENPFERALFLKEFDIYVKYEEDLEKGLIWLKKQKEVLKESNFFLQEDACMQLERTVDITENPAHMEHRTKNIRKTISNVSLHEYSLMRNTALTKQYYDLSISNPIEFKEIIMGGK